MTYTSTFVGSWNDISTFELPSGRYWIGDLCYVMERNLYDDIIYTNGIYKVKPNNRQHSFVAFDSTYAGDGTYEVIVNGKKVRDIGVDAGLIGIIEDCLIEPEDEKDTLGLFVTFQDPITVAMKNGVFVFYCNNDKITIDTKGD